MKLKLNALFTFIAASLLLAGNSLYAQEAQTPVYSVDEIIVKAPDLVGQTVNVQGKAQHVCAHSGRKIFLVTTDGQKTFRFNAGKNIDKFDKNAVSKIVTITGIVAEQQVTLEQLDKQEALAIEAEKTKKEAEHCASEAKAEGQNVKATPLQRIQAQKEKLKKQIEEGGKPYLSYYSVGQCNAYSIAQ